MKFIFLGMGAVGSLWASMLYNLGYEIIGLCRGSHYDEILKNGLQFETLTGELKEIKFGKRFRVFQNVNPEKEITKNLSPDDWIIITSKAYSIDKIVDNNLDILSRHGSVLIFQNGIGNEDIVKEKISDIDIYRGTTTMGAFLIKPGYIKHTGTGFTKIGYPNINIANLKSNEKVPKDKIDRILNLVSILEQTGYPVEYSENIDLVLWEKIFVNIGINAPAALENIPNGELLKSQTRMELMEIAIKEAWNVGKALKIPLKDSPTSYVELAFDVARKTANNKNSMLQDLLNGKPTEIDFINGKIVDYAKKLNISVPENEKLTLKIKELEKKKIKWT